ncbi:hypothetical protein LUD75_15700 [Epilithonimonas sp. JDS]|uniref:tetratricopeptide repeat protein n=1 Tax=Epilithonimonas sp. JDS TaxID=2902797 RepID=UPI001E31A0EC|nr:hypothetical protein [Epilithonimonas sp. JDS]MCD9856170.1 hypothetical protein [Epilithonimonas sp. JDS]
MKLKTDDMKKGLYILFLIFSVFGFSQSETKLEKQISEVDRMAFVDPDSALIMVKKLEPKIDDDKLQSKLLLAKGSAYSVKHLSSAALKSGFEALDISQKSQDSLMMVNTLGFIGNQYYILKLNKKAINYLNRAETIIDFLKDPSLNQMSANIYFVKALIYKDNLDPAFAITYFDKAIFEYNKNNDRSSLLNKNITRIQKGYSLIDIGKADEAEKLFLDVIQESDRYKMSEVSDYAKVGLAITYDNKKDFVKANQILSETEKKIGNTGNVGLLTEVYDALSQNYLNQNNAPQYFYYNQKLEKNLLTNDEVEKKSFSDLLKKNIETQNSEFDNNQKMFYLFVVLIILFTIVSLFYIRKKINMLKSINY